MKLKSLGERVAVLVFMLLLVIGSLTLAAAKTEGELAPVTDGAALLSAEEAKALTEKIQQIEKAHRVKIGVFTAKDLPQGVSAGKYANKLIDDYFSAAPNGGMVLVLSMKGRDYYVSTNNPMRARITDEGGFPYLEKAFLPSLKDDDYAKAFNAYADTADKLLSYYEEEGKAYDPAEEFNLLAAAAAVAMAILGGLLVRSHLIAGMSNVRNAVEAGAYLKEDSFRLNSSHDTYLFTNVTRERKAKERSSGSNSRDSGHGGGGGKF